MIIKILVPGYACVWSTFEGSQWGLIGSLMSGAFLLLKLPGQCGEQEADIFYSCTPSFVSSRLMGHKNPCLIREKPFPGNALQSGTQYISGFIFGKLAGYDIHRNGCPRGYSTCMCTWLYRGHH